MHLWEKYLIYGVFPLNKSLLEEMGFPDTNSQQKYNFLICQGARNAENNLWLAGSKSVNCQAQVRSPKVQSPKVKTKGTWADTKITWATHPTQDVGVVLHVQGEVYQSTLTFRRRVARY